MWGKSKKDYIVNCFYPNYTFSGFFKALAIGHWKWVKRYSDSDCPALGISVFLWQNIRIFCV
jgi:hypothetical protein